MENIFKRILNKLTDSFTNKIGIDLGTTNTIVLLEKRGIIFNQPTLVTLNKKTKQINAIGNSAKKMVGRTPPHLEVIQPIKGGIVADFEVTEQLLSFFFKKANDIKPKMFGPTVVIGVPCNTKGTESDAVEDAAIDSGARKIYLIQEPIAAAIGSEIPFSSQEAVLILDVGGGTSDALILGSGDIIASSRIKIAGDKFNEDIMHSLLEKYNILIGLRTAEELKIKAMISKEKDQKRFLIRGRDPSTGLPKEIDILSREVEKYLTGSIQDIVEEIKILLESIPTEVAADLKKRGVYFVGGGALVSQFPEILSKELNIKVTIPKNPLTAVARGTSKILNDIGKYKHLFLNKEV